MSMAEVVIEYGEAFRGDWSPETIDGRGVRSEMKDLAGWIDDPATYPGDDSARQVFGLCPAGLGHWEHLYCDDECTLTDTEREADRNAAVSRAGVVAGDEGQ